MAIHLLKTWPVPFELIEKGLKTAEFRSTADRYFEVGDLLLLEGWDNELNRYTDQALVRVVTHVLNGPDFGIPHGFAMLSIRSMDDAAMVEIEISRSDRAVMAEIINTGDPALGRACRPLAYNLS